MLPSRTSANWIPPPTPNQTTPRTHTRPKHPTAATSHNMSNVNLRNITNHFMDARLVSLSSWREASRIELKDRGGPYVVLQEGYDPPDLKMIAREFILGRSGKWLALEHFYRLPVNDRREEFVFGRVADVMQMMSELPSKTVM